MINYMPFLIIAGLVFALILLIAFSMMKMISFTFGSSEIGTEAPKREKKAPKPKPQKEITQKTPQPTPTPEITQKTPQPVPQPTPIDTGNQSRKNQLQLKINSINSMIQNLESQYRAGDMSQQNFFERRKSLGETLENLKIQLQSLD